VEPFHFLFDREIAGKKTTAGCTVSLTPITEMPIEDESFNDPNKDPKEDVSRSLVKDGNQITTIIDAVLDSEHSPLPAHLSPAIIHQALIDGALAALSRGPTHFYPVHSVSVNLTLNPETDIHGTTTTAAAITSAARLATREALAKAAIASGGSSLMEPVMNVLISVDATSLGAVVHDLSSARSAHVLSLSSSEDDAKSEDSTVVIPADKIYAPPDPFSSNSSFDGAASALHNQHRTVAARVPLREMVGYLKHLRSLTGGRGTFVMSVDRFEKVGKQREKGILAGLRSF
jgi:elongation factor G